MLHFHFQIIINKLFLPTAGATTKKRDLFADDSFNDDTGKNNTFTASDAGIKPAEMDVGNLSVHHSRINRLSPLNNNENLNDSKLSSANFSLFPPPMIDDQPSHMVPNDQNGSRLLDSSGIHNALPNNQSLLNRSSAKESCLRNRSSYIQSSGKFYCLPRTPLPTYSEQLI